MKLNKIGLALLTDLVERGSGFTGMHIERFRADHAARLDEIDILERQDLIERNDSTSHYQVRLVTLPLLSSKKVKSLLADSQKVFAHLRSVYPENLKAPISVQDLASSARLSRERTIECLSFMRQSGCLAAWSTDLNDANAWISPNVTVLVHGTYGEAVEARLAAWKSQSSKPKSKAHGNVEVHCQKRCEALSASLAVVATYAEQCKDRAGKISAPKVAALVESKSLCWWPDRKDPPLGNAKIRELVNKALKSLK